MSIRIAVGLAAGLAVVGTACQNGVISAPWPLPADGVDTDVAIDTDEPVDTDGGGDGCALPVDGGVQLIDFPVGPFDWYEGRWGFGMRSCATPDQAWRGTLTLGMMHPEQELYYCASVYEAVESVPSADCPSCDFAFQVKNELVNTLDITGSDCAASMVVVEYEQVAWGVDLDGSAGGQPVLMWGYTYDPGDGSYEYWIPLDPQNYSGNDEVEVRMEASPRQDAWFVEFDYISSYTYQ